MQLVNIELNAWAATAMPWNICSSTAEQILDQQFAIRE